MSQDPVINEWEKDKNKRDTLHNAGKAGMKTFLEEALKNEKIRLSVKEGLRESTKNPISKYNIRAGSGFGNVYQDDDDPLLSGLGGLSSDETNEDDDYTSIFRK